MCNIETRNSPVSKVRVFIRQNNPTSHDAPKKSRLGKGEHYGKIEYRRCRVLQPWRGTGDNWNLRVTFAYLIH